MHRGQPTQQRRLALAALLVATLHAVAVAAQPPPGAAGDTTAADEQQAAGAAVHGARGFGHLLDASPGAARTLRLGLRGSFFHAPNFPTTTATNRQFLGELTAGYGALDWLELYGAWRTSSNFNDSTAPRLVQAQGEVVLGGKGGFSLGGTHLGGDLRFDLRNAPGADHPALSGSTLQLRALASHPLVAGGLPLRLHGNLGAVLGTSSEALDRRMNSALLFGTGLSAYHRVVFAAGAEMDLGPVRAFAGLDLDLPLAVVDSSSLTRHGLLGVAAKRVTLGARLPAGAAGALDLQLDLGFGAGASGFSRPAPYLLSAAWSHVFGARARPPAPRLAASEPSLAEEAPAVVPRTSGRIRGVVVDAATGEPVRRAIVSVLELGGADAAPPVASAADGRFVTRELPPGEVNVVVEHAAYRVATVLAAILPGEDWPAEIRLEALPPAAPAGAPAAPPAFVAGRLDGLAPGTPALARATADAGGAVVESAVREDGTFSLHVAPGDHLITLLPQGHVARSTRAAAVAGEAAVVSLRTMPLPPAGAIQVDETGRINLASPLQLADTRETPAPEDFPVLAGLVDLLVRSPERRLAIGVHSEFPKDPNDNRKAWTVARAEALRRTLVDLGAPAARLEVRGYGVEAPIYPRISKERAKNRRVEVELVASEPLPALVPLQPVERAAVLPESAPPAAPAVETPAPVAPVVAVPVSAPVAAPAGPAPAPVAPAGAAEQQTEAPARPEPTADLEEILEDASF